ncbi:hypothetical protein GIB67_018852 [Kingdonia uniflora]|uniref:C3H1-type domain-containing protein n=1 Tax=Kingdonia uniflora TaxID=39325 RepID=A0A7J7NEW4_9MAGN|nr:hypothetical protein GIB67_018852 [Kingdonia uniflora]
MSNRGASYISFLRREYVRGRGSTIVLTHVGKRILRAVTAKENDGHPERARQFKCKYIITGSCKFGSSSRHYHPRDKTVVAAPVDFNFLGLPIRPGEKECPRYMCTGSCELIANCRFHYPDPTAAVESDTPSGHDNSSSVPLHSSDSSQPASWALPTTSPSYPPDDLTMSSQEAEYNRTGDKEKFGSDESEGVLFGNSRSWARLELLGPILLKEKKRPIIDFGSAILGHLYYCLDQASKQEVKYIGGIFQLIEYQRYEYCQISHYILINNKLDDFWPRISAWYTTRQKLTGNQAKHHLALMRQQLDFRTVHNMQWDPFKNIKNALKREVIIADNISRKRVILQSPFGGYKWYLGDRCWAQLEHRAVPYDPPMRLHCFPSPDVMCQQDMIFFAMTEGMRKFILDKTLDLEARHLYDESHITYLTMSLSPVEYRLSQLNDYLDKKGIVVDWEHDEGKVGSSQAETSRGRGSRGRTS